MRRRQVWSQLDPYRTFEKIAKGPYNRAALEAAQGMAEDPVGHKVRVAVFFGKPGSGKTSLLHAIGNGILAGDLNRRAVYYTASDFNAREAEFRAKHRIARWYARCFALTVCLVDDIETVAGDDDAEELFIVLGEMANRGVLVVAGCDRPPGDVPWASDWAREYMAVAEAIPI